MAGGPYYMITFNNQDNSDGGYYGGTEYLMDGGLPTFNWNGLADGTADNEAFSDLIVSGGYVNVAVEKNDDEERAFYAVGLGVDIDHGDGTGTPGWGEAGYDSGYTTYATVTYEMNDDDHTLEVKGFMDRWGYSSDYGWESFDTTIGELLNTGLDKFTETVTAGMYINKYSFKQIHPPTLTDKVTDVFTTQEKTQTITADTTVSYDASSEY